jgi:hypothetical protein
VSTTTVSFTQQLTRSHAVEAYLGLESSTSTPLLTESSSPVVPDDYPFDPLSVEGGTRVVDESTLVLTRSVSWTLPL